MLIPGTVLALDLDSVLLPVAHLPSYVRGLTGVVGLRPVRLLQEVDGKLLSNSSGGGGKALQAPEPVAGTHPPDSNGNGLNGRKGGGVSTSAAAGPQQTQQAAGAQCFGWSGRGSGRGRGRGAGGRGLYGIRTGRYVFVERADDPAAAGPHPHQGGAAAANAPAALRHQSSDAHAPAAMVAAQPGRAATQQDSGPIQAWGTMALVSGLAPVTRRFSGHRFLGWTVCDLDTLVLRLASPDCWERMLARRARGGAGGGSRPLQGLKAADAGVPGDGLRCNGGAPTGRARAHTHVSEGQGQDDSDSDYVLPLAKPRGGAGGAAGRGRGRSRGGSLHGRAGRNVSGCAAGASERAPPAAVHLPLAAPARAAAAARVIRSARLRARAAAAAGAALPEARAEGAISEEGAEAGEADAGLEVAPLAAPAQAEARASLDSLPSPSGDDARDGPKPKGLQEEVPVRRYRLCTDPRNAKSARPARGSATAPKRAAQPLAPSLAAPARRRRLGHGIASPRAFAAVPGGGERADESSDIGDGEEDEDYTPSRHYRPTAAKVETGGTPELAAPVGDGGKGRSQSRFHGVVPCPANADDGDKGPRWQAHVTVDGRQVHVGTYGSEERAAEAVDVVMLKASGGAQPATNLPLSRYSELQPLLARLSPEEVLAAVRGAAQSAGGHRTSSSIYRGVSWTVQCQRWRAVLQHRGGKHIWLGAFTVERDAAVAFDRAAVRLRGASARTNFPLPDYAEQLAERHALAQAAQLPGADPSLIALTQPGSELSRWTKKGFAAYPDLLTMVDLPAARRAAKQELDKHADDQRGVDAPAPHVASPIAAVMATAAAKAPSADAPAAAADRSAADPPTGGSGRGSGGGGRGNGPGRGASLGRGGGRGRGNSCSRDAATDAALARSPSAARGRGGRRAGRASLSSPLPASPRSGAGRPALRDAGGALRGAAASPLQRRRMGGVVQACGGGARVRGGNVKTGVRRGGQRRAACGWGSGSGEEGSDDDSSRDGSSDSGRGSDSGSESPSDSDGDGVKSSGESSEHEQGNAGEGEDGADAGDQEPLSSRVPGVTRLLTAQGVKWFVRICLGGVRGQAYLGTYDSLEHAEQAADIARLKHAGPKGPHRALSLPPERSRELSAALAGLSLDEVVAALRKQSEKKRTNTGDRGSKYLGVRWMKQRGLWAACIPNHGKHLQLAACEQERDAAVAFDQGAVRLCGASARTNFPLPDYAEQLAEHHALAQAVKFQEPALAVLSQLGPDHNKWIRSGFAAFPHLADSAAAAAGKQAAEHELELVRQGALRSGGCGGGEATAGAAEEATVWGDVAAGAASPLVAVLAVAAAKACAANGSGGSVDGRKEEFAVAGVGPDRDENGDAAVNRGAALAHKGTADLQ